MRRFAARTGAAGLTVALALAGVAASAGPAAAAATTTWRVVHEIPKSESFTGLTATGPRHAWTIVSRSAVRSLAGWNGHKLQTIAAVPAGLLPAFLSASAPDNIWVFGSMNGLAGTAAFRWNGTSWQQDNLPAGVGYGSVAVVSATQVWYAYQSTIWRWNGSSWLSSAAESDVNVAAGPGGQVWQAGTARAGGHFVVVTRHWSGTAWRKVRVPHTTVRAVLEVSVGSARDAWILVTERGGDPYRLLHWNGRGWQTIRVPAGLATESFNASVTAVGRDGAWFSGTGLWTGRRWLRADPPMFNGGDAAMTGVPGTGAALIAVGYRIWQNGKL